MAKTNKINFDKLLMNDLSQAFHVTRRQIYNWVNDGCPRNKDKSFKLNEVHEWLINRLEIKQSGKKNLSLKDQKLEKEIQLKDAQINKIRETQIEKSVMDSILAARAKSLSIYLETSAVKNSVHYVGKTLTEIQNLRHREAVEAMEVYVGSK